MYTRICYGKRDMSYNYSEFICDYESDIQNLPTSKNKGKDGVTCSIGSKALVIDSKKIYILNNSNEWKEFLDYKIQSSVGGDSVDVATADEINDYLGIEVI